MTIIDFIKMFTYHSYVNTSDILYIAQRKNEEDSQCIQDPLQKIAEVEV